ncbi:MAG: hypothetical protein JJT78_00590 [Leptospira sp.]|nr:hypothetical protein [Leptospira sp.]
MKKLLISLLFILLSGTIIAGKKASATTNLHDFMEDYTKEAMKHFKKTGDRTYLNRLLPEFPALTIEEQRTDWKKIVDQSIAEGKPEKSCKTCHDLYKKDYKKLYRKREIRIPEKIFGMDEEMRKAGK